MCLHQTYNPEVLVSSPLAPVVQKLGSAIHQINHYPADMYYAKQLRYPLDSTIQRLNNRGLIRRFVSCSLSTTYEPPCKIAEWLPPASCPLLCSIFWINLLNAGLSLKFQVGRESNSKEFLLALFFFYFPIKVAGDHTHSSRGKSPALGS